MKTLASVLAFVLTGCASAPGPTSYRRSADADRSVQHFAYFGRARERISEPEFLGTIRLVGAQLIYTWKELEPGEGNYDLTKIRKDLDVLKKRRKQLWIQIQDTTFDPTRVAVPKYLLRQKRYDGGVALQYRKGKASGNAAKRWHPAVRERWHKLLGALGKEFDGRITGINLQETALEFKEGDPHSPKDFTYNGYRDAVLANMAALRAAFPKSVSMQYANFMPGEWLPDRDRGYMRSIYQYAQTHDIAVGAPDLMPENQNHLSHAYQFMHDLGCAAKVAVGVAVQEGNYAGRTCEDVKPTEPWPNRVPRLHDFAKNTLCAAYVFWVAQEPYFSHDVVPFLRKAD